VGDDLDTVVFQKRPSICLVDIDANTQEALVAAGFNCAVGSLGSQIELPNAEVGDRSICRVDNTIPPNLHEYDIIVIDLKDREPIKYDVSQHRPSAGTRASQMFLDCRFPQTIFDPRPLAGHYVLRPQIEEIKRKESIVIVFATSHDDVSYHPVELTDVGYVGEQTFKHNNYSFLPSIPFEANKAGFETTVVVENAEPFAVFLRGYNQKFVYHIVFSHPTIHDGKRWMKDPDFIPLVVDSADDIVSYAQADGPSIVFVFPQLEDKTHFLLELFQRHLPAIKPNLFPFSTQFAWIKDDEYRLPNEAGLFAEKRSLEQEYSEKIAAKEREIEENRQKYRFLHDLLTETGEKLVKAVEQYFHWLGFDDIVNCDEAYPGRNEEDLQISLEEGLLIVEVKGIGGTSKDSECSQISKIKYRRARERDSFDVVALYIVNHQRYLPPENRLNPPFTDQQIKDAESDERGLLTTYDLFKLYFAAESGFITKEDARKSLLDFGLVAFRPSNSVPIGRPLEIHYNGTVGIFFLQDVTVRLDEELLIHEDGRYRKVRVVSLRDQDRDVAEASEGEIGIKLSDRITKESELWKPEVTSE
jgi:hypothetical protein